MPIITVDMLPGRTAEQKKELIRALTDDFVRICKTKTENVRVVIRDVAPENFGVGGVPVSEQGK
ncbi:MAG: tautomerase family protein [Symbiobacteriia bacterium]